MTAGMSLIHVERKENILDVASLENQDQSGQREYARVHFILVDGNAHRLGLTKKPDPNVRC